MKTESARVDALTTSLEKDREVCGRELDALNVQLQGEAEARVSAEARVDTLSTTLQTDRDVCTRQLGDLHLTLEAEVEAHALTEAEQEETMLKVG